MPNEISPTGGALKRQKSPDGSDSVSAANFGACFQRSADRATYLYELQVVHALLHAQNITDEAPFGILEHFSSSSRMFAFKANTGRETTRNSVSFSDQAYPGSVSTPLSAIVHCFSREELGGDTSGTAAAVIDQDFHRVNSSGGLLAAESPGITVGTGKRVLQGTADSGFVLGGSTGGVPAIAKRSSGGAWSAATITGAASGAPTSVQSIARKGSELVALLNGSANDLLYSSDNGDTWNYHTHDMGAAGTAISYDRDNGLWVSMRGDNADLYATDDPTAGTWELEKGLVSVQDFVCLGSVRLVVGSGVESFYYLRHGATIGGTNPIGIKFIDAIIPLASRLALIDSDGDSYITGVVQ